jgi:hypothetical protein
MGETRVDLLHLLEDLRDAYPGALEETILTEIVANALDSGARSVSIRTDSAERVLVVVDDGRGMTRRELRRYHDIAASTKTRGQGIGFAGVGIKLGLLASEEVLTETRQKDASVATRWKLASRHRAPWRWVDPPGIVTARGTGVCLHLKNPLSPLLDRGFIEATLRLHFEPLFDSSFDAVLQPHYGEGVAFHLDGHRLEKAGARDGAPIAVFLPRKRLPSGRGVMSRARLPLPESERGIAVSTLGKVIRRGWDWLGLTPLAPDLVSGLVEVPALAESLTLNKADFLRSGPRGLFYLAVRKAAQRTVMAQLQAWGEGRDPEEDARRKAARPLERDLEAVLVSLAEDFPTLAPLVEQRAGGQKRLPVGQASGAGSALAAGERATAAEPASAPAADQPAPGKEPPPEPRPPESPEAVDETPPATASSGPRRPTRYRLSIQFEDRATSDPVARLAEATVFVNAAHPAYRRAVASRSEGYHVAVAVAMALAPEAVEPAGVSGFLNAFLAAWGEALGRDKRRRGARGAEA